MTEGRLKGFQRELVSDKLVDKILKFPQLKAKLSGVKNLVDFAEVGPTEETLCKGTSQP